MNEYLFPYLIFQYLLFSVLMFASRRKQNRMLGITFLSASLGYFISLNYINQTSFFTENYFLCMLILVISSPIGTITRYDYFNNLLGQQRNRFHYIGSAIITLAVIILVCSSGVFLSYKNVVQVAISKSYFLVTSLLYVQVTVLNLYMIRVINKKLRLEINELSPQISLILFWGKHYLFILTLLSTSQILLLICFQFPVLQSNLDLVFKILSVSDAILIPSITILALAIGYFTLRNPIVFEYVERIENNLTIEQRFVETILPNQIKNANLHQLISEDRFEEICNLISAAMEQKMYLESTLTVQSLADLLSIPKYQLSFVINKKWGLKFNEFINAQRIDYAIEIMERPNNKGLTMFALAIDSGFNSESVFYAAFKKEKGVTPKQFFNT